MSDYKSHNPLHALENSLRILVVQKHVQKDKQKTFSGFNIVFLIARI